MENIVKEYVKLENECDKLYDLQMQFCRELFTRPNVMDEYTKVFKEYQEKVDIVIEMGNKYENNEEFQRLLKLHKEN